MNAPAETDTTGRPPAEQLQVALAALRAGTLRPHAFADHARALAATWPGLPPRYGPVLHQLLDRLEAGALFSEESCSFSPRELHDGLQRWLDHARAAGRPAGS